MEDSSSQFFNKETQSLTERSKGKDENNISSELYLQRSLNDIKNPLSARIQRNFANSINTFQGSPQKNNQKRNSKSGFRLSLPYLSYYQITKTKGDTQTPSLMKQKIITPTSKRKIKFFLDIPSSFRIRVESKTRANSNKILLTTSRRNNSPEIQKLSSTSLSSVDEKKELPRNIMSLFKDYPKYRKVLHSKTPKGLIKAFGVNSYKGLTKTYNEDRVSILLNISRPLNYTGKWPKILSMFALFDGHNGTKCCDFLRDNLHLYLIHSEFFPNDIEKALTDSFERLDNDFLKDHAVSKNMKLIDKSGSCALVVLIVDKVCYIANVGSSRAILSCNNGKDIYQLSNTHKPEDKKEKKRIKLNEGVVYQVDSHHNNYRVLPGNLPVSRTFGDAPAKLPMFGGKGGVVISRPEITKFKAEQAKLDFLLLGCDSIFDNLSNEEKTKAIWSTMNYKESLEKNPHLQAGVCADMPIKLALERKSNENLTALFIGFRNFIRHFNHQKKFFNEEEIIKQIKALDDSKY